MEEAARNKLFLQYTAQVENVTILVPQGQTGFSTEASFFCLRSVKPKKRKKQLQENKKIPERILL